MLLLYPESYAANDFATSRSLPRHLQRQELGVDATRRGGDQGRDIRGRERHRAGGVAGFGDAGEADGDDLADQLAGTFEGDGDVVSGVAASKGVLAPLPAFDEDRQRLADVAGGEGAIRFVNDLLKLGVPQLLLGVGDVVDQRFAVRAWGAGSSGRRGCAGTRPRGRTRAYFHASRASRRDSQR